MSVVLPCCPGGGWLPATIGGPAAPAVPVGSAGWRRGFPRHRTRARRRRSQSVRHYPRALRWRTRQVHGQRPGVKDTGNAERPPEGATPLRQPETTRVGVEVRSPTRQPAGRVGHHAGHGLTGRTGAVPHRNDPQQLGGWRALTASHTGADRLTGLHRRSRRQCATHHREVYLSPGHSVAGGPRVRDHSTAAVGDPPICDQADSAAVLVVVELGLMSAAGGPAASVSGRMSIRQPVNRAASRAFCPSRPIANDSW